MKMDPRHLHNKYILILAVILSGRFSFSQSMFTNSSYELGTNTNCNCPTSYICANDAGRVVQGFHPNFVVGNQGCIGGQNYFPPFGAHTGSCCVYFYAGLDRITTPNGTFAAGNRACVCVWYAGPQGSGASGQNTSNCYFRIGVDGVGVSPNILVPVNTGWTQYCFLTAALTAGTHNFCVMAGGAAQYSIWNDDFTVNICTTLPIELIGFEARNKDGSVELKWETATESNNDFFSVERSLDGVIFETLGTVKGAGNSQKLLRYSFKDKDPVKDVSYYRLKQTDVGGAFTYSHLVYVNSNSEISALAYPNPNDGFFKLSIDNDLNASEIILMNSLGEIIHKQSAIKGDNEIYLPETKAGIYNLLLFENNEKVYSSKITVH